MSIEIIKSTGEKESLDKVKLCESIKHAGAPQDLADTVCSLVEKEVIPKMTTTKIFRTALNYLIREDIETAAHYSLRRGVADLGPAGFIFEQYIEAILQAYGYKTKRDIIMKGQCVSHEIDVLAKKGNDCYLVEAKYHNARGIKTSVNVVMYSHARLIDISEELEKKEKKLYKHYAWIITNTKFTTSAIKYGKCRNITLTCWNYPKNKSLEDLIRGERVYPITVLPSVNHYAREQFAKAQMILIQDLLPYSARDLEIKFGLPQKLAQQIAKQVRELLV